MQASGKLGQWPGKPPRAHQLIAVIRSLAEHTERIGWRRHALERLELRGVTDLQVVRGLRKIGDIAGDIEPGENPSEWKCKVVFPVNHERGAREIGVVTIVIGTERMEIKTVEWERMS